MRDFIDYYSILSLPRTSTVEEIKRMYRQLAKKYHPDVCKDAGAHERFVLINEAYLILSNEEPRNAYDRIYDTIFAEKKNYPQNVSVEISSTFTEIQQKAKRKAADLAKISLKDLLNLLNEAGKDAGTQFLHIILYTLCGFFMYLFSDIFFSKDPDYAISIIGLILSLPILYFLSKKNFL